MKRITPWAPRAILAAALLLGQAAHAEDLNPLLQRLVLCQDSWQDFAKIPARAKIFAEALDGQFQRDDKKRVHIPRKAVTYLGYSVTELSPDTAGMGVGFTLTLKAPMDKVRKSFETALGKPMKECEKGDALLFCSLELAPKRTAMLVAPEKQSDAGTLIGCYYEYEK